MKEKFIKTKRRERVLIHLSFLCVNNVHYNVIVVLACRIIYACEGEPYIFYSNRINHVFKTVAFDGTDTLSRLKICIVQQSQVIRPDSWYRYYYFRVNEKDNLFGTILYQYFHN